MIAPNGSVGKGFAAAVAARRVAGGRQNWQSRVR
jgi:hypothetical protein